ncbi:MAG: hypothetical protein ACOY3K_05155 [Candidatus Omnitrophota bacterium]
MRIQGPDPLLHHRIFLGRDLQGIQPFDKKDPAIELEKLVVRTRRDQRADQSFFKPGEIGEKPLGIGPGRLFGRSRKKRLKDRKVFFLELLRTGEIVGPLGIIKERQFVTALRFLPAHPFLERFGKDLMCKRQELPLDRFKVL